VQRGRDRTPPASMASIRARSSPGRRARASSARCRPSTHHQRAATATELHAAATSRITIEPYSCRGTPSEYLESIDDKTEALIRDVERQQQDASRRARNLATNTKSAETWALNPQVSTSARCASLPEGELHLRRRHSPRKLDQLGEVYRACDRQHVGDLESRTSTIFARSRRGRPSLARGIVGGARSSTSGTLKAFDNLTSVRTVRFSVPASTR